MVTCWGEACLLKHHYSSMYNPKQASSIIVDYTWPPSSLNGRCSLGHCSRDDSGIRTSLTTLNYYLLSRWDRSMWQSTSLIIDGCDMDLSVKICHAGPRKGLLNNCRADRSHVTTTCPVAFWLAECVRNELVRRSRKTTEVCSFAITSLGFEIAQPVCTYRVSVSGNREGQSRSRGPTYFKCQSAIANF